MTRFFRLRQRSPWKTLNQVDVEQVPKLPESEAMLIPAITVNVMDGGSVEVLFLHGGKIPMKMCVCIAGIDTPKLRAKRRLERRAARHVKREVEDWLKDATMYVSFEKWGTSGYRIVGDLHKESGESLSTHLLSMAYAQMYEGGKRIEWPESSLRYILNDKR